MTVLNENGWTREGTKSGPCNTYKGRWQVRRDRARGPWVVVDLAEQVLVAGGYRSMAAALNAVPQIADRLP